MHIWNITYMYIYTHIYAYMYIYTYAHVIYINSINTNNATFAPREKYFYDDSARDRQYDADIHLLDIPENINISTTIYTIIYTIISLLYSIIIEII